MDNLSQTSSYWNGRFGPAINTVYAELFNVDPVDVPYSNLGRPTSYFLETRGSYRERRESRDWISVNEDEDFTITDCKLIYDDDCEQTSGKLYCSYVNRHKTKRKICYYKYDNGQLTNWTPYRVLDCNTTKCNNNNLNVINYVKGWIPFGGTQKLEFYEENQIVDGVTVEGFLGLEQFDRSETIYYNNYEIHNFRDMFTYTPIKIGGYVFVNSSGNGEYDGFCGQVRQILGVNELGTKLLLSSPWLGFKDIESGKSSRKGGNIEVSFFKEWGETIWYSDATGLKLLSESDDGILKGITICDYGISMGAERNVVDINVYDNIPVILYSNGYITYGMDGYNKFFFSTDKNNYVGKDKIGLISWRGILLILGKRNIDVGLRDENRNISIYTQSTNVGLYNQGCIGEYEGSIVFLSSENKPRLLSMQIKATTGHNMLEYEDIGGYIQSRLDKVREGDELYIDTYDNELKIFQQTKTVLDNAYNDCTRIYFYNKKWKVWYEHLTYSLIKGNYKNFYYGSGIIAYTKYLNNGDIATEDWYYRKDTSIDGLWQYKQNHEPIKTKICWYVNENEYGNGQQASDGGNLDLLRIIKPKSMNILLGRGLYGPGFKVNVINYRFGYATVLELKDIYKKNKWFEDINNISDGREPTPTECIEADVSDDRVFEESCDSTISLFDVERQPFVGTTQNNYFYEEGFYKLRVNDLGICVNGWEYKYSGCYPIYINFNETQSPSELVKVEIVGSGDSISFGGAIMELNTFPLDYKGADGEYTLNFEDDCPKKFLHKPNNCFT